ncbi:hypothetical protein EST38_g8472 [Candolleomyces aberdarensis]|uniref:FHA domain-containing protein n=1 Tax=Candolleomyces aberdarensis TaxID=2316362 RepID=A0A4Q2DFV9_9AGAR|nr:hypothetical protein EST38_g8472 [Candolleomyces aberdarensis]
MFRCAVVSRKHAKIAFSDSGHVYLIDLSSHHGTHVRKPSEMFSKPLKPEVAFQLSDGDIVTFGKPVGRHEECVRPVVVRVELVRNPQPIKPLVVPSTPSDKSSTSSLMKHSSGRYGVYSSSSSDERPSSSMDMEDNDSEIEAASAAPKDPGSSSSVSASSSQSRQGSLPLASGFGRAFDMLKRLIPPSHTPNIAAANEGVGAQLPPAFTLAPIAPPSSDPSPPYPMLPPLQEALSFSPQPRGNSLLDESRSSSPMDLESPSPGPFGELPEDPEDESLGGDARDFDDDDDDESSSSESRGECQSPSYSVDSDAGEDAEQREKSPSVVVVDSRPKTPEVDAKPGAPAESNDMQDMKRDIGKLQADVTRLDELRRKYRTRFNNNVHKLSDKLSHYDDRLAEVNAQYDNLAQKVETISRIEISDINNQLEDMSEQIENLAYVDIPDLQSQVDSMGEDISGLSTAEVLRRGKEAFPAPDKIVLAQQEAEEQVKTLKELVKEMEQLRETTKAQMLNNVNELKEMNERCKSTMEDVASELTRAKDVLAAAIAETSLPVSLKRKREEDDEEAEAATDGNVTLDSDTTLPQINLNVDGKDIEMVEFGVDPIGVAPSIAALDSIAVVEATNPADPSPRPRKRLRRLATVVGHTATAVTIGAVATWTALAFA